MCTIYKENFLITSNTNVSTVLERKPCMKYAVEEKKERLSQLNYKLVMTICKISLVISKPPRHAASFLQSERPYLIQKRGEFSISEIMKILVGRGGGGGGGLVFLHS